MHPPFFIKYEPAYVDLEFRRKICRKNRSHSNVSLKLQPRPQRQCSIGSIDKPLKAMEQVSTHTHTEHTHKLETYLKLHRHSGPCCEIKRGSLRAHVVWQKEKNTEAILMCG